MKQIFFFSAVLLLFSFCGSKNNETTSGQLTSVDSDSLKEKLEGGKLYSKLACSGDERFSYALYLPSDYNEKEMWPLIVFFDAHAAGSLPLEKYKKLADEFGFVLAGSNDSKNGLAMQLYPDIKSAVFGDVLNRVKVDKQRMYVGGFSGGARIAINIALGEANIAGVIANSAGFEPSKANLRDRLVIVGLAGNEDFNRMEQVRTDAYLDLYALSHCLLEFNGPHEWAPEETMHKAFHFLDVSALKRKKPIKHEKQSVTIFEADKQVLSTVKGKCERFAALKTFIAFYEGVYPIGAEEKEFSVLKRDAEIRSWQKKTEEALAKESVLQTSYFSKAFSESPEWWQKETKKMLSEKAGSEQLRMNKRILSYVSLAVYMTINSAECQADMLQLEKFISIYSIIDPKNAEWAYLQAVLRARQNNFAECKRMLSKAVELGFTDKARMKNQREFVSLSADAEFVSMCN